jgi:hypothetical protein
MASAGGEAENKRIALVRFEEVSDADPETRFGGDHFGGGRRGIPCPQQPN